MSMQSRYRFTAAWLPSGWHRNVVISVDPSGDIVDVAVDDVVTTARLIQGAAIPGMPNVHSHAFQRAMAGLAEQRNTHSDSFWTWRETMYRLAARITPESLNAIAAQLYVDMLKAGYTSVCEFHYLHNQPDGRPYDDRTIMSQAIVDAAATSGIGLTLLPTLYQTSDFGAAAPTERQRQFTLATDDFLRLVDGFRGSLQSSPLLEIGLAFHSLRAVPEEAMRAVLAAQGDCKVVHIHVAEQEKEVQSAQQHLGCRPLQWLVQQGLLDARWCLVHATHATNAELDGIAAAQCIIALCTTTEANLGDGIFPLEAWLARQGAFAVGSDSHISLSPTEELRWLEYEARLARRHRNVLHDKSMASTGSMLWRRACEAGARASGRAIGSLEPGRRADIVVLDLNTPLFAGRSDETIVDTFVFAGPGHAVRDVMVAGRWLVQEGRHFADTAICAGYKRAIQKLIEAGAA
jgi:formimidoylglutamate deiminase